MLKQAKTHPANVSQSEKQFEFEKRPFNAFYGTLTSAGYVRLKPGRISEAGTDEAGIADILLQPIQSKDDQSQMVHLDARIKIKNSQLRTMRLQVAVGINSAVTQKQMETVPSTAFPMAAYAGPGVTNQTEWRTICIVLGWI